MDDLTIERSLDFHATWVIGVLGLFLDMLSMGACNTRRWQTSGRLVQEINVCTVVDDTGAPGQNHRSTPSHLPQPEEIEQRFNLFKPGI